MHQLSEMHHVAHSSRSQPRAEDGQTGAGDSINTQSACLGDNVSLNLTGPYDRREKKRSNNALDAAVDGHTKA